MTGAQRGVWHAPEDAWKHSRSCSACRLTVTTLYVTGAEAAELTGIPERVLRRMAGLNMIDAQCFPGGMFINPEDVAALMEHGVLQ